MSATAGLLALATFAAPFAKAASQAISKVWPEEAVKAGLVVKDIYDARANPDDFARITARESAALRTVFCEQPGVSALEGDQAGFSANLDPQATTNRLVAALAEVEPE